MAGGNAVDGSKTAKKTPESISFEILPLYPR
jgi:hypothetical protein